MALASPLGHGASRGSAGTTQLQRPGADAAPHPPPTSPVPYSTLTLPCPRQSAVLTPLGLATLPPSRTCRFPPPPSPELPAHRVWDTCGSGVTGPMSQPQFSWQQLRSPLLDTASLVSHPQAAWGGRSCFHVPVTTLGAHRVPGAALGQCQQVLTSQCPRGSDARVSVPRSRPVEVSAPTMPAHDQGLPATAGWQSPGVMPRLQRLLLDSLRHTQAPHVCPRNVLPGRSFELPHHKTAGTDGPKDTSTQWA